MQYGIRLAREDIEFCEFLRLLSGVMPDTPLGRLVAVRAEKDAEVLKGLGKHDRRIRADWAGFLKGRDGSGVCGDGSGLLELQEGLARMFG